MCLWASRNLADVLVVKATSRTSGLLTANWRIEGENFFLKGCLSGCLFALADAIFRVVLIAIPLYEMFDLNFAKEFCK